LEKKMKLFKTIKSEILSLNQSAIGSKESFIWDYHNSNFSERTKLMQDANLLAMKLAAEYSCEFTVYAITGTKGRSTHSKTQIILIAMPLFCDDEIERCGRGIKTLVSVRNSK